MTDPHYTLDLALADARTHISRACERLLSAQQIEQAVLSAHCAFADDATFARLRFSALALSHLRAELLQFMERLP